MARAAGAEVRTLDIPELQVAIYFEDDEIPWHHRVCLVEGGTGRWVLLTPDHELEVDNLSLHTVAALTRAAPFPQRLGRHVYAFDQLDDAAMRRWRSEAHALALAVGFDLKGVLAPGPVSRWLVADPGRPKYGTEVAGGTTADAERFIERASVGIANVGPADQAEWVAVENVSPADEAAWKSEKHSGPGRDHRLLKPTRVGRRRVPLADTLQALSEKPDTEWPFRGPRAITEFLNGVEATGLDLPAYYGHWQTQSGVHAASGVALELKNHLEVLRHLLVFDQLNVASLAGAELLARRCLQIQRAVRRCPRHPTFDGLECMLASTLDESGGVVASRFDQFVAEEQKTSATILKQMRLWREETTTEKRERGEPADAEEPPAPRGGRGRGKKQ